MASTRYSIPSVIKISRRISFRHHRRNHRSKNRKQRKIVDHTKVQSLRSVDQDLHKSKSNEHKKKKQNSASSKHSLNLTTLDTKQCKDNEWNTDLNTIKGYTLSTDLFQLNARQSDIGLSTTHARISFSQWSNRTNSLGDIHEIIDRKKRHNKPCFSSHCYCCCPLCGYLCLFGCVVTAIGIAALLVGLLSKSNPASTTSNPTSTTTTRPAIFNVNLVTNGNAETGTCGNGTNITNPTGWNYNGTISQVYYNSVSSGQKLTSPGPNDRGNCYFSGGISLLTSMWQTIDLNNYVDSGLIDTYTVKFNLSAWLGGFSLQNDNAIVSLTFINQFNQNIGSGVTIGPVLAIDRGSLTSLLFRQTQGLVPVGTRFITVTVTITCLTPPTSNGDVDNIAVVLYQ